LTLKVFSCYRQSKLVCCVGYNTIGLMQVASWQLCLNSTLRLLDLGGLEVLADINSTPVFRQVYLLLCIIVDLKV